MWFDFRVVVGHCQATRRIKGNIREAAEEHGERRGERKEMRLLIEIVYKL